MKLVSGSRLGQESRICTMMALCLATEEWRARPGADFDNYIITPALIGNCIFGAQGKTLTVAMTFATLDDEAAQQFAMQQELAPNQWDSGDNFWIIDLVSPYGGTGEFLRKLRKTMPNDMTVSWWNNRRQELGSMRGAAYTEH